MAKKMAKAKKKKYTELNKTPFNSGVRNFTRIAEYFLYYAPNIESCQSAGRIEGDDAEKVFEMMKSNINAKILKKIQPNSWKELDFYEDSLDFEYSRMLFNKMNTESTLTALLRHIRNSLAHGYIYVWNKRKKGSYILFVDFERNKKTQELKTTAKIMVSMNILEKWKAILENEIAIGE